MTVKYTDIDYWVFTDASRYVSEGLSPYLRATYRYTPILSFMMLPNIWWHPIFGKLVFVCSDILIGLLLWGILEKILVTKQQKDKIFFYVCVWLFNPIVINVATRGNAESLVSLFVLISLYLLVTERIFLASIVYGFSVHFKIYPVIWAVSVVFYLERESIKKIFSSSTKSTTTTMMKTRSKSKENEKEEENESPPNGLISKLIALVKAIITKRTLTFAFISFFTFMILNAWMYSL